MERFTVRPHTTESGAQDGGYLIWDTVRHSRALFQVIPSLGTANLVRHAMMVAYWTGVDAVKNGEAM